MSEIADAERLVAEGSFNKARSRMDRIAGLLALSGSYSLAVSALQLSATASYIAYEYDAADIASESAQTFLDRHKGIDSGGQRRDLAMLRSCLTVELEGERIAAERMERCLIEFPGAATNATTSVERYLAINLLITLAMALRNTGREVKAQQRLQEARDSLRFRTSSPDILDKILTVKILQATARCNEGDRAVSALAEALKELDHLSARTTLDKEWLTITRLSCHNQALSVHMNRVSPYSDYRPSESDRELARNELSNIDKLLSGQVGQSGILQMINLMATSAYWQSYYLITIGERTQALLRAGESEAHAIRAATLFERSFRLSANLVVSMQLVARLLDSSRRLSGSPDLSIVDAAFAKAVTTARQMLLTDPYNLQLLGTIWALKDDWGDVRRNVGNLNERLSLYRDAVEIGRSMIESANRFGLEHAQLVNERVTYTIAKVVVAHNFSQERRILARFYDSAWRVAASLESNPTLRAKIIDSIETYSMMTGARAQMTSWWTEERQHYARLSYERISHSDVELLMAESEIVHGEWRVLAHEDAKLAVDCVSGLVRSPSQCEFDGIGVIRVVRVSSLPLSFYLGWELIECYCLVRKSIVILDYLRCIDDVSKIVIIDGRSEKIYALNEYLGLAIDNEEQAGEYVNFFCSALRGSESRFSVVTAASYLPLQFRGDSRILEALKEVDAAIAQQEEGEFKVDGIICYAGGLFRARMVVQRSGEVEMVDDDPLAVDQSVSAEALDGPWRICSVSSSGSSR